MMFYWKGLAELFQIEQKVFDSPLIFKKFPYKKLK
tara:strand:- start:407 stop:511 length:105 start_codon:yes stop_codon:yes gene_type:complete